MAPLSETDRMYMKRCLQLASYGGGYVAPNPMVGAVLVCEDKIIGEGFHRSYGKAHAEPEAIASVADKSLLKKATLYVNLEPCAHQGKTPPCARLIADLGIARVVVGCLDPNPKVCGRGMEMLRAAGVEVELGILEDECRELNKRFFTFQTCKRPYITLKWAQTKDGFIDRKRSNATEKPLLISNRLTQTITHKVRSQNQAILVGANTALLDNPKLTLRFWSGKNPLRLSIDREGRIPENYHLKDGEIETLIFTEQQRENRNKLRYLKTDLSTEGIEQLLSALYQENVHSVLVEGGTQILNSFLRKNCWDEVLVEISPIRIGEGVAAPPIPAGNPFRNILRGHECLLFRKQPQP